MFSDSKEKGDKGKKHLKQSYQSSSLTARIVGLNICVIIPCHSVPMARACARILITVRSRALAFCSVEVLSRLSLLFLTHV